MILLKGKPQLQQRLGLLVDSIDAIGYLSITIFFDSVNSAALIL